MARLHVNGRRWTLLSAPPGTEFVTSDIGMVKSTRGFETPADWDAGTLGGRFQWLMPISPERAIAITDKNLPEPGELTVVGMEAILRQLLLDARVRVLSVLCRSFDVCGPSQGAERRKWDRDNGR